jgi:hypothetical protein
MGDMTSDPTSGMDTPSAKDLPSPSPDVVSRRVGDEAVLVDLKTNRIFALSPTGARFWELLSDGRARPEIERQLLEEYDVEHEQVTSEIDALVETLEGEGLVTRG